MHQSKDIDIVIPARGREEAHIVTFFVRDGKLTGREVHELDMMPEAERSEMVSAFINQYYSSQPNLPKEILLTDLPGDSDVLEEYLTGIAGHNVKLLRPQKGEKKALVDMASKDVVEMVKTIDEKAALARERRYALGSEIFDVLRTMGAARGEYSGRDFRAEAYDISNTNGVDTVAAMVVFEGLDPDRQSYRKFRIRSIQGQDTAFFFNAVIVFESDYILFFISVKFFIICQFVPPYFHY